MTQLRDVPPLGVEHNGKVIVAVVDGEEIVVRVQVGLLPFTLRIPPQLARRLRDWLVEAVR